MEMVTNQFKAKVNSPEEKILTDQLNKIWEERELIAKEITSLLSKYKKNHKEILPLEQQVYALSGEWGLDEYTKKAEQKFPNAFFTEYELDWESSQ